MSSAPLAVSFDLDGTLYSTRHAALRVLWQMRGELKFLSTYQKIRRNLRKRDFGDGERLHQAEHQALAAALHISEEEAAHKLREVHDQRLCSALGKAGPDPYARPLIMALTDRGIPVAVLSDLPVDAKLDALGLADLPWTATLDATDCGALKPHPRPFERVAKALGVELKDLVHVGDRHDTDVTGAQNCGAQAIWLSQKGGKATLPGTITIPSLSVLFDLWELTGSR